MATYSDSHFVIPQDCGCDRRMMTGPQKIQHNFPIFPRRRETYLTCSEINLVLPYSVSQ